MNKKLENLVWSAVLAGCFGGAITTAKTATYLDKKQEARELYQLKPRTLEISNIQEIYLEKDDSTFQRYEVRVYGDKWILYKK